MDSLCINVNLPFLLSEIVRTRRSSRGEQNSCEIPAATEADIDSRRIEDDEDDVIKLIQIALNGRISVRCHRGAEISK